MLKNLTFWAEIDEIDGFLVIFYSSKILVKGLTTNGHHKSFFCYLFYVAIYMRYLKSVVRPLVLFFWEVCVSGLQWKGYVDSSQIDGVEWPSCSILQCFFRNMRIHLDFYEAINKDYYCIIEIFWRRSFVLYVH